ncbi:hypothetical protein [Vreelandella sp. TE19]
MKKGYRTPIIAVTVLILAVMFKNPIEGAISRISSIEWGDKKFSFASAQAYQGELSSIALYYLMGAALSDSGNAISSGIRYGDREAIALAELKEQGLVEFEVEKSNSDSPEMQGTWAVMNLTPKGKALLKELGFHFGM